MIVQHNYSPVVFLGVVVLVLALVLGLFLGNSEILNPTRTEQEAIARARLTALEIEEQRVQLAATQTPRALAQQATAVPLQLTATRMSDQARLEVAQTEATRDSIAGATDMRQAEATATMTAMDHEVEMRQTEVQVRRYQPFFVAAVGLILAGGAVYAVGARMRMGVKEAEARALAEQRRLLIVQQTLAQASAPVVANRAARRQQMVDNGGDGRQATITSPKRPPRPTA